MIIKLSLTQDEIERAIRYWLSSKREVTVPNHGDIVFGSSLEIDGVTITATYEAEIE